MPLSAKHPPYPKRLKLILRPGIIKSLSDQHRILILPLLLVLACLGTGLFSQCALFESSTRASIDNAIYLIQRNSLGSLYANEPVSIPKKADDKGRVDYDDFREKFAQAQETYIGVANDTEVKDLRASLDGDVKHPIYLSSQRDWDRVEFWKSRSLDGIRLRYALLFSIEEDGQRFAVGMYFCSGLINRD